MITFVSWALGSLNCDASQDTTSIFGCRPCSAAIWRSSVAESVQPKREHPVISEYLCVAARLRNQLAAWKWLGENILGYTQIIQNPSTSNRSSSIVSILISIYLYFKMAMLDSFGRELGKPNQPGLYFSVVALRGFFSDTDVHHQRFADSWIKSRQLLKVSPAQASHCQSHCHFPTVKEIEWA